MTKAMYIGIQNNPTVTLPSGYTQLEYIESSGTQYIDTGFTPNQNTRIKLEMQLKDNSAGATPFGCRNGSTSYFLLSKESDGNFAPGFGSTWASSTIAGTVSERLTVELSSSGFIVGKNTVAVTVTNFDVGYSLTLFARNSAGTIGNYANMKLYSCQIYDNGTLVRNLVPVKNSSGAVGLYDVANSKFYTNGGSGTFTAGTVLDGKNVARKVNKMYVGVANKPTAELPSGYTEVEYIESSGTQYIDTGFVPNSNSRINIRFQFLASVSATNAIYGARTAWANSMSTFELTTAGAMIFGYGTKYVSITPKALEVVEYDMNKNVASANGSTSTITANTFTAPCPAYLFAENNNGSPSSFATGRMYSCKIYDNGSLVRNFVPCKNSSGTVGLYDTVNSVFYTNAGSGTFAVGTVLDGKGVARKVLKGYIGVNGIARKFFGKLELKYKGKATSLSEARTYLASASVGNYALFAGGYSSSSGGSIVKTIDAYSSSLTRSTSVWLNSERQKLSGASIGNYALFAGGCDAVKSPNSSVESIDASLTRASRTGLNTARYNMASTVVGNYAIFAGGQTNKSSSSSSYFSKVFEAYNTSLSRQTLADVVLQAVSAELSATTLGNYAIFAGGCANNSTFRAHCQAVDGSLTSRNLTNLSVAKFALASATVGDYAIFSGGACFSPGFSDTIDVIDKSLTKIGVSITLSVARMYLTGIALGNYAIFAGGYGRGNDTAANDGTFDTVDVFDESLTRVSVTGLSLARESLASATVGNYALFAGGIDKNGGYSAIVDVYELS
jgi:hypothetical protein